jgi:hypothetical protein
MLNNNPIWFSIFSLLKNWKRIKIESLFSLRYFVCKNSEISPNLVKLQLRNFFQAYKHITYITESNPIT